MTLARVIGSPIASDQARLLARLPARAAVSLVAAPFQLGGYPLLRQRAVRVGGEREPVSVGWEVAGDVLLASSSIDPRIWE